MSVQWQTLNVCLSQAGTPFTLKGRASNVKGRTICHRTLAGFESAVVTLSSKGSASVTGRCAVPSRLHHVPLTRAVDDHAPWRRCAPAGYRRASNAKHRHLRVEVPAAVP